MKRIHAAVIGAVVIILAAGIALWQTHNKTQTPAQAAQEVYAYADIEHVMMSHPKYAAYHRLELEYNAMIAQYQFEQWNYSRKAAAEGKSVQLMAPTEAAGNAALDQELKAKMALKEHELNEGLKQQYELLVKEKRKTQPIISQSDNLKIVNLQLKLQTLTLTSEERQATENELKELIKKASTDMQVTNRTAAEIEEAMIPYKQKAQEELAAYGKNVKADLEKRKQAQSAVFQTQLKALQDRPEPAVWNKEWKEKLDAKEQEVKAQKEEIMADIRRIAAVVAREQGIDVIFADTNGVGTAQDVTDDIIARLA